MIRGDMRRGRVCLPACSGGVVQQLLCIGCVMAPHTQSAARDGAQNVTKCYGYLVERGEGV